MTDVGSWAWATRTGGRLNRRDRAHLIHQGVLAGLGRLPGPWRTGILEHARDLALPEPPDSRLAREAEARVRELSAPALHGHCLRTWAFADLFARRDRVEHDGELLYVACVMHDLGLTAAHDQKDPSAACFAVEGARAAHAFLIGYGERIDRADAVAEAISLHLNVTVPDRYGPIASLLSKGVSLDVVGRRIEALPVTAVARVNAEWPREGSGPLLSAATEAQARARPRSRSKLLHQARSKGWVPANPLDRPDHTALPR